MLTLTDTEGPRPTVTGLRQFLIDQGVARFMLPDSVRFVDHVPLTAVGKIARQQLVAQIQKAEQKLETEGVETPCKKAIQLQIRAQY